MLEQKRRREVDPFGFGAGRRFPGWHRGPAQVEEVVVNSDALQIQNARPDLRQASLPAASRGAAYSARTSSRTPCGAGSRLRSTLPDGFSGSAGSGT